MSDNYKDAFDDFIRQEINKTPIPFNAAHWMELNNTLDDYYNAKVTSTWKRTLQKNWKVIFTLLVIFVLGLTLLVTFISYSTKDAKNILQQKKDMVPNNGLLNIENDSSNCKAVFQGVIKKDNKNLLPKEEKVKNEDGQSDKSVEPSLNILSSKNLILDSLHQFNSDTMKMDSINLMRKKKKHLMW